MPLLNGSLRFPPVDSADEDGLLAYGGDLSVETLLTAYKSGIFPWYNEGEPILWWCPDPRFVLIPSALHISRSMQKIINSCSFEFSTNTAFSQVIHNCKNTPRKEQDGTWITKDVEEAYSRMYEAGYAKSAETWTGGKLVGGLYGIRLGKVFFGESMFSLENNASKFAFIKLVQQLASEGVELIDCQVYTAHLESLGASMISRAAFSKLIEALI